MVKGRTFESREEPVILEKAMNPSGGAIIIGVLIVASLGIACLGGVGAGGEKPPATRL